MAIQILPSTPSLGQNLGNALGTGLGAGISGLVQSKLADIERQKGIHHTQNGLQALGLPAEIAGLPEGLQQLVVKQALQQPGQESYANALSALLGGGQQEGQGQNISPQNLR